MTCRNPSRSSRSCVWRTGADGDAGIQIVKTTVIMGCVIVLFVLVLVRYGGNPLGVFQDALDTFGDGSVAPTWLGARRFRPGVAHRDAPFVQALADGARSSISARCL
jgi:hypothetical protein